ncbi:MAG: diguanylate cyclase [Pseudomonadota bacterium]
MHGKVLVIDPIATNRIALRVKLAANHYDVLQAGSIAEAMQAVAKSAPDLILTSTRLPDGGALKLLARLRRAGLAGKVPIIALYTGTEAEERLRLLGAGFDDVIAKPVDDTLLMARARSLLRAYATASEWQLHDGTSRALGFAEHRARFGLAQRIKLVSHDPQEAARWRDALPPHLTTAITRCDPHTVLQDAPDHVAPEAYVMMVAPGSGTEMLALLATIRSHATTRHSTVLVVQMEPDPVQGAQLLDMGANDLMPHSADPAELALRLDTLLTRKQATDALRDTVRSGIEAAVVDPLTGLHNRRYAMPHLARIAERASQTGKPFAVMVADMDHFKQINDRFGHAAGDAVLVETARRLRDNVRAVDLVARIGGEEFLIVLPGVELADAKTAAGRLCRAICSQPIQVPGLDDAIAATVSIGLTVCDPDVPEASPMRDVTPNILLDRADKALFDAKAEGRNRVMLRRPAA